MWSNTCIPSHSELNRGEANALEELVFVRIYRTLLWWQILLLLVSVLLPWIVDSKKCIPPISSRVCRAAGFESHPESDESSLVSSILRMRTRRDADDTSNSETINPQPMIAKNRRLTTAPCLAAVLDKMVFAVGAYVHNLKDREPRIVVSLGFAISSHGEIEDSGAATSVLLSFAACREVPLPFVRRQGCAHR